MNLVNGIQRTVNLGLVNLPGQAPRELISIQTFPDPRPPNEVVRSVASIEGPVDVYCWYEGTQGLPQAGALFMKASIFEPLFELKKNVKLLLYSLRSWDFKKRVEEMPVSTPLGEVINRIDTAAIECIYASVFFRYCTQVSEQSRLSIFINEELPKKDWLFKVSEGQRASGMRVAELFNRAPLFDCIKDLDVAAAYAPIQYVEGYYLIQESVRKGLAQGQKKIQIAFVLANDESKYYEDFPKDIPKLLRLNFGEALEDIEINVSFRFFEYGDSPTSRTYVDKRRKAPKVEASDISSYFNYLLKL